MENKIVRVEVRGVACFMCQYCGCSLELGLNSVVPPNKCPECDQGCAFVNITCYTPECGNERNIDPKIMAYVLEGIGAGKEKNTSAALADRASIDSDGKGLCYEAALVSLRKLRGELALHPQESAKLDNIT